jgi:hypothetical protein
MFFLTVDQATQLYNLLCRYEVAKPEFKAQFIHDQVRGQYPLDWDLKRPLGFGGSFYRGPGPGGGEEWILIKQLDDERIKTYELIDEVNLALAELQNTLFP